MGRCVLPGSGTLLVPFLFPSSCCKERRKTWYVSLLNSIQPLTVCPQARYTINTLPQGVWVIG